MVRVFSLSFKEVIFVKKGKVWKGYRFIIFKELMVLNYC